MGLGRRVQGARRRRCRCTSLTTSNAEIARNPHAPFGFRRHGGICGVGAPRRCTSTSPASRRLASAPVALGTRYLLILGQTPRISTRVQRRDWRQRSQIEAGLPHDYKRIHFGNADYENVAVERDFFHDDVGFRVQPAGFVFRGQSVRGCFPINQSGNESHGRKRIQAGNFRQRLFLVHPGDFSETGRS